MTPTNEYLNKTPYYVFKGITDQNGYIEINMKDLLDGNTYDIYITAGNNYPYEPPLLLNDGDVQHIRITTPINQSKIYYFYKVKSNFLDVKGRNVNYNITYQYASWN